MLKAEGGAKFAEVVEFLGGIVFLHRQVAHGGAQILADGDDIAPGGA